MTAPIERERIVCDLCGDDMPIETLGVHQVLAHPKPSPATRKR